MRKGKSQTNVPRTLVLHYLERVSSKLFKEYPEILTGLVGGQHGVYALYKGARLYYVGLASNLRGRVKQHLKDKHKGKWDKFSLYLVRRADHIKELEAIIMRVAHPAGNAARGRLSSAKNLRNELERLIKEKQSKEREALLGGKSRPPARKVSRKSTKGRAKGRPVLAPYITKGFWIRREYKGKMYKAYVNRGGTVKYNGKLYTSPWKPARLIVPTGVNGWTFWRYRNEKGEWVALDKLRKK